MLSLSEAYNKSVQEETTLTPEQSTYLDIPVSGPYKPSHYRY